MKLKNNIKTIKSIRVCGFSLPIIMSNFKYRQKIFGKCALLVKHYNPKDIAEKVLYLLDNPDRMRKMGKGRRKLVEDKYSWEMESIKLLEMDKTLYLMDI